MADKKLRTLRSLRLALSVLAVLLFCLAVVSGILRFSGGKPTPSPLEPIEQTAPELHPLPSDEPEAETEAPDPDLHLDEDTDSEIDGIGRADPNDRNRNTNISEPPNATMAPTEAPTVPSTEAPTVPSTEAPTVPSTEAPTVPSTEAPTVPSTEAKATTKDAPDESEKTLSATASAETPFTENTEAETTSGNTEDAETTSVPELIIESSEVAIPAETEEPTEPPCETTSAASPLWTLLFRISICLLIADLAAIGIVSLRIRELKGVNTPDSEPVPQPSAKPGPLPAPGQLTIGTIHCQGRRQYQQDSLGHSIVLDGRGMLAVVADGMGGLKDGDKVSQKVVLRTLELGSSLRPGQENGALSRILKTVNEDVNRFLTPDGLYKSGSTVVAVLVSGEYFHWISVGDSRIYLYRAGYVNQLNRDHDLLQDWMPEILDGSRSLEASRMDPAARKLTSFIGMGQLKYVDRSLHAIKVMPGDRILLMSDGVYGQLPDEQMAEILRRFPDVRQAAAEMDRCVRATQNPHQDNYTALILGF